MFVHARSYLGLFWDLLQNERRAVGGLGPVQGIPLAPAELFGLYLGDADPIARRSLLELHFIASDSAFRCIPFSNMSKNESAVNGPKGLYLKSRSSFSEIPTKSLPRKVTKSLDTTDG